MKRKPAAMFLAAAMIPVAGPVSAALDCARFTVIEPGRATLYLTDCGTVFQDFKSPVAIDASTNAIRYGTSYSNSPAGVCYQGSYPARLDGQPVTVLISGAWVGGIGTDSEGPYQQVLTQHSISDEGYADDRYYAVDTIYFMKNYETERVLGGTGRFAQIDPASSGATFGYIPSAATSGTLPVSITVTRTQGGLCFND